MANTKKNPKKLSEKKIMAALKAKKKDTKSKQIAAPINDAGDVTEEESIHEDVEMEDIPEIVAKESDAKEMPPTSSKVESKKSNTSTKPKEQIPFMDTFYQLSSDEPRARSIAARDLISHCFTPSINTTDAAYALTRLMNGLCTGRAASRQGFASALATFLRVSSSSELSTMLEAESTSKDTINDDNAATIFRLKLLNCTQFQQNEKNGIKLKGMEERDHAFGRLFGILAVVRSGILGSKDFPCEVIEGYITDLIELYNHKNWLREPSANAIIELLSTLDGSVVVKVANTIIVPKFFPGAAKETESKRRENLLRDLTAEQIAVALHLQSLQNKVSKFDFPLDKTILTADTVSLFAATLTSTSIVVYPRCHIVWNHLWLYLTEECDGQRQLRKVKGSYTEYASIVKNLVDYVVVDSLLGKGETSGSPSNERKSLALQIVSTLAGASNMTIVLPPELIGSVLCSDVVQRVFLNVLCASGGIGAKRSKAADSSDGNVQHHLRSLTSTILSDIVSRCSDEDFINRRLAFVKAFVSVDPRFDVRSKTQTVSTLLMMNAREIVKEKEPLQKELWNKYLSFIEESIITADTLHDATMYIELASKLAKCDLINAPANEARRVIRFFMTAAFFDCSTVSSQTVDKQVPSSKKKKGKKKQNAENSSVSSELSSAFWIKEVLQSHKLDVISDSSRAIMASRFYSLISDLILTVNSQSRGGNKSKPFYGNASKPESVYRALSEISGIASVLELSGAKPHGRYDGSRTEISTRHMLDVKKIADEALVNECGGSSDAEALRAKSLFTTGAASLIISLHLQLHSVETDKEDDESDAEEEKDAIHEYIADLFEIVSDFTSLLETPDNATNENNPLAAMVSLLVNILSSSAGGEDSGQSNILIAPASKLTRETVKLAWSGVLSLISSLHRNSSTTIRNFVDADVMSTLIESVCGQDFSKEENEYDESMEESDEDDEDNDDKVFAKATDMDLDLDDDGQEINVSEINSTDESESSYGGGGTEEELDSSQLESMLLEDSDAEIDEDVLEHHEGADKALAALIKMKQDTRKASQSERERIDFCNRLRCVGLLDSLFSTSVFKSGWLPLDAVLGSFIPILSSYRSIAKSIEKSSSNTVGSKSISEKKSLLDRLFSLIQEKISRFRCADGMDTSIESLQKAVCDISKELNHSINLSHCSLCSIALVTVIRCIPDAENNAEVEKVYSAAMRDWMSRKTTKIHTCVFDDLIQRLPNIAASVLVEPLAVSARDAHSAFIKCESLKLLSLFYRGDKRDKENALTEQAQAKLNNNCNNVTTVLVDSLCDPSLQKTKNKDEILNAVKHFTTYAKSNTSLVSASKLNKLKDALDTLADKTKSAGMKNSCAKLAEEVAQIAQNTGAKTPKSSAKKKTKKQSNR